MKKNRAHLFLPSAVLGLIVAFSPMALEARLTGYLKI